MSFLATFTRLIGHYRPLNSYIECSLGNGKGEQIPNLHKNRRQNILKIFTVFGKTAEFFFYICGHFFCCVWKMLEKLF